MKTRIISGQSLCTAMSECNELNTEDCPECLSGQRECDKLDNQCWINGLCQGSLIKEVYYSITYCTFKTLMSYPVKN